MSHLVIRLLPFSFSDLIVIMHIVTGQVEVWNQTKKS
uniref:Uncharacterized protein n=1 Tax=Arundo donax TaxID=35708 RepID=A0A0A9A1P6_ARUDO